MNLLKQLIEVQGVSSDEGAIHQFILDYVNREKANWKCCPEIIRGEGFQDCLILVFGSPRIAVYAHMDTVGFSVAYHSNLLRVGSPQLIDGSALVGRDSSGAIEAELMVIEDEETQSVRYVADREIDRGTMLSFKPDFRENSEEIRSPYLDNRAGVWVALKLAEELEHGALVFTTYEEHGGNSVAACARYLEQHHSLRKALICDLTWVTSGVKAGQGVAISMRDSFLPRRSYLERIIDLAGKSGIPFQMEVESTGGSDGSMLQRSELMHDWCFIGAPEHGAHSPNELVAKKDLFSMLDLYRYLMKHL